MEWTDVQITVETEKTEAAAEFAREAAPGGVYIEDYSDLTEQAPRIAHVDYYDDALLAKSRTQSVVHLYLSPEKNPAETLAALRARLDAAGVAFSLAVSGVREEDWANAWKAFYHPVRLGKVLTVCPSWEDYSPAPGERVIVMDPGMAFGSGTHQTTRLCCALLEDCVAPGARMADLGCGSGILSVAALLLGAQRAFGVDIDPVAVRTAKENAERNGVAGRFSARCGDLLSDAGLRRALGTDNDVAAANIVADVILGLRGVLFDCLKPGGKLVASGIIGPRAGEVEAGLAEAGFALLRRETLDNWCALLMQKKA